MLADAGLSDTKSLFSRVEGRKIGADTPGWDAVADAVFANANEGAAAELEALQARVAGWKYHKDYAKSGEALAATKGAFYADAAERFDAMRAAREERNRQAQAAAGQQMMPGMMPAAAPVDKDEIARVARQEAFALMQAHGAVGESAPADTPVEYDSDAGQVRPVGHVTKLAAEAQLAKLRDATSDAFVQMMAQDWTGRVHPAWDEVAMNGAPMNLVNLYGDVAEGKLTPGTDEYAFRVRRLANQVDQLRVNQARDLAVLARHRGLDDVAAAMERVADDGTISIEQGGLPQPIWWDATRMAEVAGQSSQIREVSRGLSPNEVLDQWEKDELVDAKTIADLRAAVSGELDYRGKKVMIYGGTGTISKPTVQFFLTLGADVWITTRRDFGGIEDTARALRNEHAVRGAKLRVSTQFVPNKANMERLKETHEGLDWKPDIIINGMASEDYGSMDAQLDFHTVTEVLVDSYRFAVGQYMSWYKDDPDNSPVLAVGNQTSPNDKFALGYSGSYSPAKAAMPAGQFAQRRESEGYYYSDGRPVYREVSVYTGAVVPPSDRGIMGPFRSYGDRLEQAARAEGNPLWIFNGADMGAINVAVMNPAHGNADQIDRIADGGFEKVGHRDGGLADLVKTVQKGEQPEGVVEPETAAEAEWHPFHDGQLRTVTDYGFYIDEVDGETDNPYAEIQDDDFVVVGAGMVTTWGNDTISTFANVMQFRGDYVGPWGANLGLRSVAHAVGHDVSDMTPDQVMAEYGPELLANMGPRILERGRQRADAYHRFQTYVGQDEVVVGTAEEVNAGTSKAIQRQLDLLADSDYQFVSRTVHDAEGQPQQVIVAVKENANLAREVKEEQDSLVFADLPPLDWSRLGADDRMIDYAARNIMMGLMVLTESDRHLGLSPQEINARHGRDNIFTFQSNGMGPLELLRRQQQSPQRGEEAGQLAVVLGIPSAGAGRIAADRYGSKAAAGDTPGACNTGPHTLYNAVQYIRAQREKAHELERRAERAEDEVQRALLRMEAERHHHNANHTTVHMTTGDDAATVETIKMFREVGAMMEHEAAQNKEFPLDKQQRPHDKDRVKQFQAGTGSGAFTIVTGWAAKQYGYKPLYTISGTDVGTDGPSMEPNGKRRAWTGLGRWGQRKVFYNALREARMKKLPRSQIRQMTSHSTGTGGDGTQSESYLIGAMMEEFQWAAMNITMGSKNYPQFQALLKEKGLDASDFMSGYDAAEQLLHSLGFPVNDREFSVVDMINAMNGWPESLRRELGLDTITAENHAKSNLRHTLGGTSVEGVTLVAHDATQLTHPHGHLNNVVDETGMSPVATTYPDVTDLSQIHPPRPSYATAPSDVVPETEGIAGNSFGFNGLDGFYVLRRVRGRRFETTAEAEAWFTEAIRAEANAIAKYRATQAGDIPAIELYDSDTVDHTAYEDTRQGYENAEELARRIVAREEGVSLPWQTPPEWLRAGNE